MSQWWNKYKNAIIVLGIVGILLALFLMPAFSRVSYEVSLGEASEFLGKNKIFVLGEVFPDIWNNLSIAFTKNPSDYFGVLKIFFPIYFVLCAIILWKASSNKEYANIEHGSADWCPPSEAYTILNPKKGMVLADKYYLPIIPEAPRGKNGNILVIGGSGAGKSASFVIPNALQILYEIIYSLK